ncbi:MAG: DEAD/DEAH box helicase [Acidimicrobiales bacterium]|nr:DEAD/DEAH box helicase [Acidimicrobiales bacterium]
MSFNGSQRHLYRWQLDALVRWLEVGRRGVIEAVTGSGKTNVAMAAIADAHRRGLFVMVVVPSRVLIQQWHERLTENLPECTIGRLGDSKKDKPKDCDILIATRHSAATYKPSPPTEAGGLLVADECHGFGGGTLRKSLRPDFQERLGLTATLERSDDAVERILLPYFGGVCYRYDFAAAIRDGVCAQPRVAFVSVPLTEEERHDYVAIEHRLVESRRSLRSIPDMPLDDFGAFLAAVSHLAAKDAGPNGRAANDYLKAFSQRREIVSSSTAKYDALGYFGPSLEDADGALIFTETVRAANHAVNRLDPDIGIEVITGGTPRKEREEILKNLRHRNLDAVAAPRVLDEGVDVPNANLGIVVSASRTRRQMIQRMGRILRRKEQGSGARFVIIFARDTLEDPTTREDRDGFLDEMEAISESSQIFDDSQLDALKAFLDYSGPDEVIEPVTVGPLQAGSTDTDPITFDEPILDALHGSEPDAWSAATATDPDEIWSRVGPGVAYAHLSYLQWTEVTPLHKAIWAKYADEPPVSPEEVEYLELQQAALPAISKEKPKKKTLSTGENPVALVAVGKEWVMRCTGCGATSDPTPYKFQALDLTVECVCVDD